MGVWCKGNTSSCSPVKYSRYLPPFLPNYLFPLLLFVPRSAVNSCQLEFVEDDH